MKTIVERGSAHIIWQRDILLQEARLTGLSIEVPSAETIHAELAEYAEADYIAVPSDFARGTFIAHGVASEKIIVNPYGVDLSRFKPEATETRSDRRFRIIHVGRCSAQKGVHHLVDAVAPLPEARLRFVGGVPFGMRPRIERSFTEVVGPVALSELPAHYSQSDVFCLLSVQEGLALVIAQAMASGLPVIATPNTGAEEMVRDGINGYIVPIRSPDTVSRKLKILQENPTLRHEMGCRARESVLRKFSWGHYGDRAIKNYRALLGRV